MPSVRTRSKMRDISFRYLYSERPLPVFPKFRGLAGPFRFCPPWRRLRRGLDGVINRRGYRRYRMGRPIMLRGQTEEKREQDKADGPLLFGRQDENLAANLFSSGPLHFGWGLTWRERYLPRMCS